DRRVQGRPRAPRAHAAAEGIPPHRLPGAFAPPAVPGGDAHAAPHVRQHPLEVLPGAGHAPVAGRVDAAVTRVQKLGFYATPPHECNYLPGREAVTLFADPRFPKNTRLYSALADCGFRRSGEHLYIPHCSA